MSDRRPAKPQDPEPNGKTEGAANPSMRMESDPLELIEQCLASFPDSDPRQKILYKLRHAVIVSQAAQQQREVGSQPAGGPFRLLRLTRTGG